MFKQAIIAKKCHRKGILETNCKVSTMYVVKGVAVQHILLSECEIKSFIHWDLKVYTFEPNLKKLHFMIVS